VILLQDHERPGPHMRPYEARPLGPVVPIVVDPVSGAELATKPRKPEAFPQPAKIDMEAIEPAVAAAPIPVVETGVAAQHHIDRKHQPEVEKRPSDPLPLTLESDAVPESFAISSAPVASSDMTSVAPRPKGYLVIDTETTGFKENRMAAIAMIFADENLEPEFEYVHLVKPTGWRIEAEAAKVNGLTVEQCEAEGVDVIEPIVTFETAMLMGRTIVAHNIGYDLRVIRGEMRRLRRGTGLIPYKKLCTMTASRKMLDTGKLARAHELVTGSPIENHHEAAADARACLAVLKGLVKRGLSLDQETTVESIEEIRA